MLLNYRELLMKLPPLLAQVLLVICTKVKYLMATLCHSAFVKKENLLHYS